MSRTSWPQFTLSFIPNFPMHAHPQEMGSVLHELDLIGCGVAQGKVVLVPVSATKPWPSARTTKMHQDMKQAMTWCVARTIAPSNAHDLLQSVPQKLHFDNLKPHRQAPQ